MVLYEKDRNISKKNCTSHIFCFMIQEEVNHEKLIYNFSKIFMNGGARGLVFFAKIFQCDGL